MVEAVADALRVTEPPTVDELSDAVIERLGDWAADPVVPAFTGMWPRWRQALHTAGHRGALCFGPGRGRKVTCTSPDRWLPGFTPMDPDKALAELAQVEEQAARVGEILEAVPALTLSPVDKGKHL